MLLGGNNFEVSVLILTISLCLSKQESPKHRISRSHLKDGQRDLCSRVCASPEERKGKLGLQCSVQVSVQALGLVLNAESSTEGQDPSMTTGRLFLRSKRLPCHSSDWPESMSGCGKVEKGTCCYLVAPAGHAPHDKTQCTPLLLAELCSLCAAVKSLNHQKLRYSFL